MLDLVACPSAFGCGSRSRQKAQQEATVAPQKPLLRPARARLGKKATLGKKMDLPVASAKREDVLRILQHREVSTPASSTRRPEAATFVW